MDTSHSEIFNCANEMNQSFSFLHIDSLKERGKNSTPYTSTLFTLGLIRDFYFFFFFYDTFPPRLYKTLKSAANTLEGKSTRGTINRSNGRICRGQWYVCVRYTRCRSERVVEYVVVEENGGDESHSHKELAIHTACFADTTRCRARRNVPNLKMCL